MWSRHIDCEEPDVSHALGGGRSVRAPRANTTLTTPVDATAWASACRAAFLDGYASVAGAPDADAQALTRALELDKALYEVVYKARNRPSGLPIPLGAVERLTTEEGTP